MPLEQNFVYKVWKGVDYIQGEGERIIGLLKDVRLNLSMLDKDFEGKSLQDILEVVEKNELVIKHQSNDENPQAEISYNIDLSYAKNRINQYRNDSEGGCKSCKRLRHYMPLQDEHVLFCDKYEKKDIVDSGHSPRITQFFKTGCGEKETIISKKLEEVLKNHRE